MPSPLTMYSTPWCGYCRRLKSQMAREGIPFVEVDIEADPAAAKFVEDANNGNQTVPTVIFPDGTVVTNPPIAAVRNKMLG
ncbi:MAG: mycoredoxin [Candidatus Nanopelagicales bacterium]